MKVIETWDGLKGSLKIIEPWDGWVERVLKGHGAMGWLCWKGPKRSWSHEMVGLDGSLKGIEACGGWAGGGSLKVIEIWDGWVGRDLEDHRVIGWVERVLEDHEAMGWLGWEGP